MLNSYARSIPLCSCSLYPPVLYLLFARVHSNFVEKVAFLHFLTLALCTFDTGKSAKSDTIVQKKA